MASLSLATAFSRDYQLCSSPSALPLRNSWPSSPFSTLKRTCIKATFPGGFVLGRYHRVARASGDLSEQESETRMYQYDEEEYRKLEEYKNAVLCKLMEAKKSVDDLFLLNDPSDMDWASMKFYAQRRLLNLQYAKESVEENIKCDDVRIDDFAKPEEDDLRLLVAEYRNHLLCIEMLKKVSGELEMAYMGLFMDRCKEIWMYESRLNTELFPEETMLPMLGGASEYNWKLLQNYLQGRLERLNLMEMLLHERMKSQTGQPRLEESRKKILLFKKAYELIREQTNEYREKITKDTMWYMRHFKNFYVQNMDREKSLYDFARKAEENAAPWFPIDTLW